MSAASHHLDADDKLPLGGKAWPAYMGCFVVGFVGLAAALILSLLDPGEGSAWRRFFHSYLIAYMLFLGIGLGCMFFLIITHLFKAGWCAAIRRIPEAFAASMPTLAALGGVLVVMVIVEGIASPEVSVADSRNYTLYAWNAHYVDTHAADHDAPHDAAPHDDEAAHADDHARLNVAVLTVANPQTDEPHNTTPDAMQGGQRTPGAAPPGSSSPSLQGSDEAGQTKYFVEMSDYFSYNKQPWLTWWFFSLRVCVYFAIWCFIGLYHWKQSRKQDENGPDYVQPTEDRQSKAPWMTILFALTITFAAFDLLMSIDPAWYSTIFGVYYFAGSFLSAIAAVILTMLILQRLGYLRSVHIDHFHDLGKLMFAFVFFWGYIAFSQYMLIWYAALPETTYWFELRGITTRNFPKPPQYWSAWTWIALLLLFGKLLIPFLVLLPAKIKRTMPILAGMAAWLIFMQYMDLYWLVMPMLDRTATPPLPLVEVFMVVGVGGIAIGAMIRRLKDAPLVAYGDPRLHESLGLDTTAWAPLHADPRED